MKTSLKTKAGIIVVLAMGLLMASCSDERETLEGNGTLVLSTAISSDVKISSRATNNEELAQKSVIWISNQNAVIRKYHGLNSIPSEGIKLLTGDYIAEIWTGDSVSADFEKKYYKGRESFTITNGSTTRVEIVCKIANSVVAVDYSPAVDDMLKNYSLTVGHKRGELTFEGRDTRRGYFMMPTYDKTLIWSLEGTLANGETYTRTGQIEDVKPNTLYNIKVSYDPTGEENPDGGSYFAIEIDERTNDIEDEVSISLAPQFEGYHFNLDEVVIGEKGEMDRRSVICRAVGDITNFYIESDLLEPIIGGRDVDLFNMTDEIGNKLNNAGINAGITPTDDPSTILKLIFEDYYLNSLEENEYVFNLSATDSQGKTNSASLRFNITDAPILVENVNSVDVWGSHALVTARILKDNVENPGISYRCKGDSDWIPATVTEISRSTGVSAELTGLTPGTTYQYTATAKDFLSQSIHEFTTEKARQLPNSSFENWQTSSTPYLIYGVNDEMFWDSGNHGSAKMSKNVTLPSEEKKHSGKYSVKLNSQFVGVGLIGKFAAGNIFIGEYLATDGTDGVLGWGRTWNSRPSAVKVWAHYTPHAVTSTSNDVPNLKEGDMDSGKIYIAILDEHTSNYDGKAYPVICKTKTKEFFDKNSDHVIAYGEYIFDKATEGEDMVEITIPLTYKITDKKAANIMLVAAASQYGDYFAGGDGSVLYLDDFTLVY